MAGAFNPTGTIEAGDGGYRVTGRWSFASGCEHADWIYGNCIEGIVDGVPQLRIAVFSPDQVVIEDTWTVSGLSGTGSHHFQVDDVVVPAERTCAPMSDEPCVDAPIVRIPIPALISLVHRQRRDRHRAGRARRHRRARHGEGARCSLTRRSPPIRCSSSSSATPTPSCAPAGRCCTRRRSRCGRLRHRDPPSRSTTGPRARAAAVWATERAAAVVDTAYRLGGGSSLYADCPLQRRLRDVHALDAALPRQARHADDGGAIFAGQDVDVIVF